MKTLHRNWMLAFAVSSTLLLGVTASAQKKDAPPAESADTSKVVDDLGLAAQLAAFGRGELNEVSGLKDFTSPEALVAAGGLTLRAHKETAGQVKASSATVMEDGKPIVAEGAAPSLEADAEELFDQARELAKDKAAIEARIKQAKLVPSRGAVGGPQVISRNLKSGKTHNLEIGFESNSPATVTMRSTGKTQFEVVGPGGKVFWHSMGNFGTYHWHTGGKGGVRNITVKVINNGGPPVSYTVITN